MIVIYELTESQLYNNYTIRYLLYYSLRRREPTTNERKKISTFFLKNGEITYKWYVSKEKNWLRSVYSPLVKLNTKKCCICKTDICLSCLKVTITKQRIKELSYNHNFYSVFWFRYGAQQLFVSLYPQEIEGEKLKP